MIYSPWFIELALESLGFCFCKSKILRALLAFLAASDIILAIILNTVPRVYGWAYWAQRLGKYFILILLACSICGMLVDEKDRTAKIGSTAIIALGTFGFATVAFSMGHSLKDSLLAAEIATNMLLAGIIILAWMGRKAVLSAEQKTETLGFVVLIASDFVFTLLWMKWHGARHFYPLGVIPAYLIWIAEPLKAEFWKLRISLERLFIGQHQKHATATIERLINSTANNSYGKAQRTMARRIIEELHKSQ